MGYELHITRRANWFDEGDDISLAEWLAVVQADPEMRLDGQAEATLASGETLIVEEPGIAVWTAYSRNGEGGGLAWFYWFEGEILFKRPDREIIGKMVQLAERLGAKVQGDEGELYLDASGDPEPMDEPAPAERSRKPWWKFW